MSNNTVTPESSGMPVPRAPSVIVGERFSKSHVFNEREVRAFATAAGDTNPLHHDRAVAQRSRYGQLIVSGTHTTALLLGLAAAHFSRGHAVVGRSFTVDFRRAVAADAAVQIMWEVTGVSMVREGGQHIDLRGGVYDEGGELCVQAAGALQLGAGTGAPVIAL